MLDAHADEADKRFHGVRQQVLARDHGKCQYCGFAAERYQEIHHLDDNHGHNELGNLATICCFCHLSFHLGMAGIRSAGLIIWCPEHSQAELNNIARAVFVAVSNKGTHEEAARTLYNAYMTRASVAEESLGKGASNPANLGQALLNLTQEAYATRGDRMHGFRILPRITAFAKQVTYWQTEKSLYAGFKESEWDALLGSERQEVSESEA